MPTDLLHRANGQWRIDLGLLYPEFAERLLNVLALARQRGQDFYPTEGHRSFFRSNQLHKAYMDGGPKAAPAGFSAHNYGIACDLAADSNHDVPGLQTAWEDPAYAKRFDILKTVVPECGLHWGGEFGDRPHIGWPGFVNKKQLTPLYQLWIATPGVERDKLKVIWSTLAM